jgi:hypothetical protein
MVAVRDELSSASPSLMPKKAEDYMNRYLVSTITQGHARTTGGNRVLATLGDEWLFQIDPERVGEATGWYWFHTFYALAHDEELNDHDLHLSLFNPRLTHAFKKAMETYDVLAELQQRDPRLRIHSISTATDRNIDEIKRLTTYLYERCPKMDHHNLAIIRGDRKNSLLKGPSLRQYQDLYQYIRRLWAPREESRYGAIVEPMLQWTKVETINKETQIVPCRAGILSAVVYANGDLSICETHKPLGNLRQKSFWEMWKSDKARELRTQVACKACWCTTEVFMWPSIVYQPQHLVRVMLGTRVWEKPKLLGSREKGDAT